MASLWGGCGGVGRGGICIVTLVLRLSVLGDDAIGLANMGFAMLGFMNFGIWLVGGFLDDLEFH